MFVNRGPSSRGKAMPTIKELNVNGSRRAIVRWSDDTTGEAMRWFDDEVLFSEGDHGNSRLMSPRAEMRRAAGSVRAPRGT